MIILGIRATVFFDVRAAEISVHALFPERLHAAISYEYLHIMLERLPAACKAQWYLGHGCFIDCSSTLKILLYMYLGYIYLGRSSDLML